jgi:hypothetical protein
MTNFTLEHQVVAQIENLADYLECDYLKSDADCEVSEEYDEAMFHHQLRSVITKLRNSADNLRDEIPAD